MIKADLARKVYERHGGISYQEAQDLVEQIIGSVKTSLVGGENVKLTGFGSLNIVNRKGRRGRNPQTGERITLPPSKYISFRPTRLVGF